MLTSMILCQLYGVQMDVIKVISSCNIDSELLEDGIEIEIFTEASSFPVSIFKQLANMAIFIGSNLGIF